MPMPWYNHPRKESNLPKFNNLKGEILRNFNGDYAIDKNNFIELLVNPIERKLAIRSTAQNNRCGITCSQLKGGKYYPKNIPATIPAPTTHASKTITTNIFNAIFSFS